MLSGPLGFYLSLAHAPSGSLCPAAPVPRWVWSQLLPAWSSWGQVVPLWHLFGRLPMPGAASGWRLGHIACSGEQAACSGRWHPSSGLQAASGTLLGQGIVLASGPSRGSVFGEVAQSLDLQVGLVLFPTTLHTSLGKGYLATPVFPHCFGCIAAATCLQMQSPRGWCLVTLRFLWVSLFTF